MIYYFSSWCFCRLFIPSLCSVGFWLCLFLRVREEQPAETDESENRHEQHRIKDWRFNQSTLDIWIRDSEWKNWSAEPISWNWIHAKKMNGCQVLIGQCRNKMAAEVTLGFVIWMFKIVRILFLLSIAIFFLILNYFLKIFYTWFSNRERPTVSRDSPELPLCPAGGQLWACFFFRN